MGRFFSALVCFIFSISPIPACPSFPRLGTFSAMILLKLFSKHLTSNSSVLVIYWLFKKIKLLYCDEFTNKNITRIKGATEILTQSQTTSQWTFIQLELPSFSWEFALPFFIIFLWRRFSEEDVEVWILTDPPEQGKEPISIHQDSNWHENILFLVGIPSVSFSTAFNRVNVCVSVALLVYPSFTPVGSKPFSGKRL